MPPCALHPSEHPKRWSIIWPAVSLETRRVVVYGAGIELASSCTKVTTDRGKALMFITAGAGSALGNQAYGALAGKISVCSHLLGRCMLHMLPE